MSDAPAGRFARGVVKSTTLACVGLLGLGVLAGCSSTKGSAGPTSSATTETTAAPGTSTTVTTTSTVPECTGANDILSLLGTQGAAGTNEVTFGLKNTASVACPLYGYPGIQLIGANGVEITTTTNRGGGFSFTNFAPTNVSVAPGATAYFNISYSDVVTGGESSCPTTTVVKIIPPNSTVQLQVAAQFMVCNNGTVTVSPVFGAGSPETQTTAPPST